MVSPSDLPENVLLLPSASDNLARLLKKNRPEVARILDDLKRLGRGTLPPEGKKKLRGIQAFQFDSGRYRVVYSRRDTSYEERPETFPVAAARPELFARARAA